MVVSLLRALLPNVIVKKETKRVTNQKLVNVLIDASKIIERDGWCQGKYRNDRNECCLAGALLSACPDVNKLWDDLTTSLAAVTSAETGFVKWNDHVCKSKQQAISALHEAASLIMSNKELF
jgi:hypothetical protein